MRRALRVPQTLPWRAHMVVLTEFEPQHKIILSIGGKGKAAQLTLTFLNTLWFPVSQRISNTASGASPTTAEQSSTQKVPCAFNASTRGVCSFHCGVPLHARICSSAEHAPGWHAAPSSMGAALARWVAGRLQTGCATPMVVRDSGNRAGAGGWSREKGADKLDRSRGASLVELEEWLSWVPKGIGAEFHSEICKHCPRGSSDGTWLVAPAPKLRRTRATRPTPEDPGGSTPAAPGEEAAATPASRLVATRQSKWPRICP